MTSIQNFFDNNPAIAGILVFVIISVIIIVTSLVVLFVIRAKKNKIKLEQQKIQEDPIIEEEVVEEVIKEEIIDNTNCYTIDFNDSGNLKLINLEDESTIENPTKQDFLNVLNNNEFKLLLPEKRILILKDEETKQFKTSESIKDKNLFIFKSFVKFMSMYDTPWAISKFA